MTDPVFEVRYSKEELKKILWEERKRRRDLLEAADELAKVCTEMRGYFPLSHKLEEALAAYEKVSGPRD